MIKEEDAGGIIENREEKVFARSLFFVLRSVLADKKTHPGLPEVGFEELTRR